MREKRLQSEEWWGKELGAIGCDCIAVWRVVLVQCRRVACVMCVEC